MSNLRIHFILFAMLPVIVLTGCATNIPTAVQQAPAQILSVTLAQQSVDRHLGRDVRWGGEIIFLENASDSTDIAILATSLGSRGKPDSDGLLDARFIARIGGFLDPLEYIEGRQITVTGVISGLESRMVGEYVYSYPLVQVHVYHLWPKEEPSIDNHYYRDPFYGPWSWYGPWGRYPYRW